MNIIQKIDWGKGGGLNFPCRIIGVGLRVYRRNTSENITRPGPPRVGDFGSVESIKTMFCVGRVVSFTTDGQGRIVQVPGGGIERNTYIGIFWIVPVKAKATP